MISTLYSNDVLAEELPTGGAVIADTRETRKMPVVDLQTGSVAIVEEPKFSLYSAQASTIWENCVFAFLSYATFGIGYLIFYPFFEFERIKVK